MKLFQLSISSLLLMSPLLFFIEHGYARDCELVETRLYQKSQNVIVTDWHGGLPYKKHKAEIYHCAQITVQNNFWQTLSSEDFTITATFADQNTAVQKLRCEKKRIEPGEKYSCDICFESEYSISSLDCAIR